MKATIAAWFVFGFLAGLGTGAALESRTDAKSIQSLIPNPLTCKSPDGLTAWRPRADGVCYTADAPR